MKSLGFILAVLTVGIAVCGGGYGVKYTQQQATKARETLDANQKEEQAKLEAQLADTRSRYYTAVNHVNAEVRDPLAPAFLVQKLNNLEGSTLNDRAKNLLAFYCLQGLADVGTNAIPAIKDYFVGYADTEIEIPNYPSPHTIRQEMAIILCDLKTHESAALLSQLIPVTQTPIELRNLSKILIEIDSNLYKSYCIKAAEDMYFKHRGNEKWKQERRLLYRLIFDDLEDKDFVNVILEKGYYFDKDSKLDHDLMEHVFDMQHEQAIPWFYAAYNDPRMKKNNLIENNRFVDNISGYVGINTQATEIYSSMVGDAKTPLEKVMLIANVGNLYSLTYEMDQELEPLEKECSEAFDKALEERRKSLASKGEGTQGNDDDKDEFDKLYKEVREETQKPYTEAHRAAMENLGKARLAWLDTIAAQYPNDSKIQKTVAFSRKQLEYQIDPNPDKERPETDEFDDIIELLSAE